MWLGQSEGTVVADEVTNWFMLSKYLKHREKEKEKERKSP